MSAKQHYLGLMALGVILLALGFALWHEDTRQSEASAQLRVDAIDRAVEIYATNCVACHGASGEGIGSIPALASDALRAAEVDTLSNVISRGRYNTNMAAWDVAEGGILYHYEVSDLVTLIQYGDWNDVYAYVDAAGLVPPQVVVAEVSTDVLAQVAALPNGDVLSAGLTLYAENCVACHNVNGEGTALAPALNTADFRTVNTDEQIQRTISQGVSGTLMAGWSQALTVDEIDTLVLFLRDWETLNQAQIMLPAVEAAPAAPASPETIAAGGQLYSILCTQCHGTLGQGTALAPALNNQTFLDTTPDAAIQQIISMGVSGTRMPAWGGRLTEADITAITAYLRSWQPTAPPVANP
jgi:cytochrome c oxidase cbb3-type subunit 3